jgi:peptidoglycan/xylan/chitin deacetylase (PgdA/CDA1 family)
MKAAFYMPTAHLDGYNEWDVAQGRCRVELMNAAEIKELSKLGMEVGAHGHRHVRMGDISDASLLTQELALSRSILQEISGQPILSMAYPFGSVPVHYKRLLQAAGFRYGLSIYQAWESLYALRRFIYHDGDTDKSLLQKLSFLYRCYRSITDPLKK